MALETIMSLEPDEEIRTSQRFIMILVLLVAVTACMAPSSKAIYLERFESFVDRVEENHKHYTKEDWQWADRQFKKYSTDWYMQFRGEYKLEDQIKIKSLIIEFHSYRDEKDVGEILRDLIKEDVNAMGEKIQEYIDNDLEKDLDELIGGAAIIGDSVVKVLEDVIEEIEESF